MYKNDVRPYSGGRGLIFRLILDIFEGFYDKGIYYIVF